MTDERIRTKSRNRAYDDLMWFWKHPTTGACHASLRGTRWPGYQMISADEYTQWYEQQQSNPPAPPATTESEAP